MGHTGQSERVSLGSLRLGERMRELWTVREWTTRVYTAIEPVVGHVVELLIMIQYGTSTTPGRHPVSGCMIVLYCHKCKTKSSRSFSSHFHFNF